MEPPMRRLVTVFAILAWTAPATFAAQERAIVFQGARILPVSGPEIPNGVLVVQGGRIVAVGRAGAVPIPAGAEVRDARGKVLIPGLVDTHSHIGDGDGGDRSSPIQVMFGSSMPSMRRGRACAGPGAAGSPPSTSCRARATS